jgi:hypothetical protein
MYEVPAGLVAVQLLLVVQPHVGQVGALSQLATGLDFDLTHSHAYTNCVCVYIGLCSCVY